MAAPVIAPSPSNCRLGRGEFLFQQFTAAGALTGSYLSLGNASDASVDPSEETVELPNYLTADGGSYASDLVSRSVSGSLRLYEWSRNNLALMAGGTEGSYTQAAAAVTGEVLTTAAILGATYQTAKRKLTLISVLMNTTTTLVLDTDYSIKSAERGEITILATSATVTAGATLTVNYTPTAITGTNQRFVSPYAAGSIHGKMKFNGVSANGQFDLEMIWWHVVLQSAALENLISKEYSSSPLNFKVMSDPAGTYSGLSLANAILSPYGRVWLPYGVA